MQSVSSVFKGILENELPLEERLRMYVEKVIQIIREDPRKTRIFFSELFLDVPEVTEYKAKRIKEVILPLFQRLIDDYSSNAAIFGPAIVGMISFHFMMIPVFTKVTGLSPDDDFYQTFTKKICDLALFGLIGGMK